MAYLTLATVIGGYFTFASTQGEYGVFRRIEIEAEARRLRAELHTLREEVGAMHNRTRRLSDAYLDLDLLDERARDVLGLAHAHDVVLR